MVSSNKLFTAQKASSSAGNLFGCRNLIFIPFSLLFLACIFACSAAESSSEAQNLHSKKEPLPAHHLPNGHFRNTDTLTSPIRDTMEVDSLVSTERTKVYRLPIARGNEFLWNDSLKASATWIGHATFYIRWNGTGIITDPIFSDRSSPVPFFGPKRGTPPGRALDSLPPIDLVLISHSHYDHLDKSSIKDIHKKYPRAIFAVPLKVAEILEDWGIPKGRIIERDWWETAPFRTFTLTFVPTHHTSRRGAFESSRDISLWGGWVLEKAGKKLWFMGDGGMGDGNYYKEIAAKFAPMDICFLPIGSYKPSRFTRVHISPRQAAQLHLLMQCKASVGMHWGDFGMTYEKLEDPPKDLARARTELHISEKDFRVMQHGEIMEILK
jgi:N-acyl-phosphatidylethanolamine-hydrolysing phospholipase D